MLFGGGDNYAQNDTWEWDGQRWSLVSEEGPPPLTWHSMTYDSARGVVVLFGGEAGYHTYSGDTWEWDGVTWRLAATSGPEPRARCGLAYDSAREVTVMYGGYGSSRLGDTWEWDGANWTLVSQAGPDYLTGFTMAYDSDRNVTVLVGSTREVDETWQWDGHAWELASVGAPTSRWESAMAYDSVRKAMVIFSGTEYGYRGDTWELAFPVEPRLEAATGCPYSGNATVTWSCASPNGTVAIVYAAGSGNVIIPPGQPCAGTQLGLGRRAIQLAFTARSNSLGAGVHEVQAPRAACGGVLQLIDLQTCTTSSTVPY